MRNCRSKTTHPVVFYTRPGCCLCDDARDILQELAREYPVEIEEFNILSDPDVYERYKNTIPVVVLDDNFSLDGRIEKHDLLSLFQRLRD